MPEHLQDAMKSVGQERGHFCPPPGDRLPEADSNVRAPYVGSAERGLNALQPGLNEPTCILGPHLPSPSSRGRYFFPTLRRFGRLCRLRRPSSYLGTILRARNQCLGDLLGIPWASLGHMGL